MCAGIRRDQRSREAGLPRPHTRARLSGARVRVHTTAGARAQLLRKFHETCSEQRRTIVELSCGDFRR